MSNQEIHLLEMLKAAEGNERKNLFKKNIERFIRDLLDIPPEEAVKHDESFSEIGLDSITAVQLKNRIDEALGKSIEVSSADIFDYPNINAFSQEMLDRLKLDEK